MTTKLFGGLYESKTHTYLYLIHKEGTKYYSIKGVSIETAIAVEVNGKYIKAIRKGEYPGWKYSPFSLILGGLIIFIILTLLIYLVQRKVNSRKFFLASGVRIFKKNKIPN
ncbi:hypothetical protein [Rossellomorea sp. BNER]|uniref:hypothetical protein n=1 Tax=Rossellomorea sp. BNER TaxID=2962031 RepID=UPI003AF28616|nr:hypothetical protein [Rossellomorea sp. BNER]